MAFKILAFCALLAVAKAGYLGSSYGLGYGYGGLGYAHSYATPLAYSAGHYGSAHLSTYSSPILSKTIATAPLAYSAPLDHYSTGLHHYHSTPIISKSVYSAPIVSAPVIKSYSPALHYSAPLHAHSLYSSHISTPLIGKSYGLGYSSYPSYGYASKYHF